uniref:Putative RNA-binding protein n=1 Tax=Talaromyces marneffei PM1 TaxID=1077442 RepID=A0A093V7M3_TALMA
MHMTTSPPRERGRRGHRSSEEEFVLYLQGIPQHCRWQELKDFVRQTALHIRQAVVYDDQHGYPTGLGQIIVKNEDEAWRTYRKLSTTGWDGHPLTVTLARASSPTRPIAGPTKSSSASGPILPHGGKVARNSVVRTPTPESPATTEPIQSHSIATGTIYPQYITPCTPTRHSHGHLQGFSPMMESPGGYGHHHHHTSAGWNVYPDGLGMLTFPSPAITMFPPPPMEQQQIEYPYYFPYSHPMQIPVRGQPMYTETRYPDYHQQQGGPSAFFSQFPPAPSQYYYHHQQQGYHVYGYESRKPSFHSSSTSEIYPNTAAAPYSNEGGINPHQALTQGIRHIIIDNICPGVDIQTLQDHFRDAGHMLHCQIIRDNENGHEARCNELSYPGQCYATATFSTAEEAERAVGMYNGSDLGGSRVVVRLDTEYDPSTAEDSNITVIFIVVYGFVKSAVSVICVVVDGYDFGDIFSVFWIFTHDVVSTRIAKLAIIEHSSYEQDIPVPQPSATSR